MEPWRRANGVQPQPQPQLPHADGRVHPGAMADPEVGLGAVPGGAGGLRLPLPRHQDLRVLPPGASDHQTVAHKVNVCGQS